MRARPTRFSDSTGLRLCGIDEEPFWPAEKYSSASNTSVRCKWRISVASRSTEAATTPSVAKYMAWRSRGMICVEIGSTLSPILPATRASTRGLPLGERTDAAENRAGRDLGSRRDQALFGAGELGIGDGEFQPERGRLGVDAVGAADGRRELVFAGAALERFVERFDVGDQKNGGAHHA